MVSCRAGQCHPAVLAAVAQRGPIPPASFNLGAVPGILEPRIAADLDALMLGLEQSG